MTATQEPEPDDLPPENPTDGDVEETTGDPHAKAWLRRYGPEMSEVICLAMCLRPETLCQVTAELTADDFGRIHNRLTYEAILSLEADREPVTYASIVDRLERDGKLVEAGGIDFVADLIECVWTPDAPTVRYWLRKVKRFAAVRMLHDGGLLMAEAAKEGQDFETVAAIVTERLAALSTDDDKGPKAVGSVIVDLMEHVEKRALAPNGVTGVPSGFTSLDEMTCGWQPSEMAVLAARPSVGKTAFALNVARAAAKEFAKDGRRVLFMSLEMPRRLIVERLLSLMARVDGMRLRSGNLDADEWAACAAVGSDLQALPLLVDDTSGLTLAQMRARAHQVAAGEGGLGLIVIDYLQLLRSGQKTESQTHETTVLSAGVKALAKELDVPVIVLSQLSRAVEARKSPRPTLSDLRQSGAIEQDADLVGFLWRHDYQDRECEHDEKGKAYLTIAKQRNGPTGELGFVYGRRYNRFEEMTE